MAPQSELPPPLQTGSAQYPSDFQKKTLWYAVTFTAIAVIAWLVAKTVGVVGSVLQFLQPVLVPLATAGILAYLLEPLIRRLTDRGIARFRAMVYVFAAFHLLVIFMVASVAVPTLGHVSNWASSQTRGTLLPRLEQSLDQVLGPMEQYFAAPAEKVEEKGTQVTKKESWWKSWLRDEEHSSIVIKKIKDYLGPLFTGFLGAFGYLLGFIMVPLYLYYFLKDSASIQKNWTQFLPLRASHFKSEVVDVLTEINGYLIAFFRGAMLVSIIDGVLVGLGLLILGLPYATLIGLCVALFGLLPYVGHLICWAAAMVVALLHFGAPENRYASLAEPWAYPLIVTLIFAVIMKVNALVTAPKIIGDAVGLHPMTVIFSVLFWSLLFGPLLGALLAVPMSAAVKVLFRRYIWQNWAKKKEALDAAYNS